MSKEDKKKLRQLAREILLLTMTSDGKKDRYEAAAVACEKAAELFREKAGEGYGA